jgi:hypothetical protein
MLIPAATVVAFTVSSKVLISSSTSAGALPVLASRPMRPDKYSVLPASIAPLNGNCGLSPGRLIALRAPVADACERAWAVKLPAITRATNTATILGFTMERMRGFKGRLSLLMKCIRAVKPGAASDVECMTDRAQSQAIPCSVRRRRLRH